MIRKYPYTDFHELNLDWFLRQFKELKDNWDALLEANTDFKNDILQQFGDLQHNFDTLEGTVQTFTLFVTNYFDNLDVQAEINNKLNDMAADGTLGELLEPFVNSAVPGAVETWLEANVDPVGSAVMIDKSLTLGGSAADAAITGDFRNGINATCITPYWKPALTQGSYLRGADGIPASSTKYARTAGLWAIDGERLGLAVILNSSVYEMYVSYYGPNGAIDGTDYLGYTGWGSNIRYVSQYAKIGVTFRRVDQANITSSDITAIQAALSYISFTDTDLTSQGTAADACATGYWVRGLDSQMQKYRRYINRWFQGGIDENGQEYSAVTLCRSNRYANRGAYPFIYITIPAGFELAAYVYNDDGTVFKYRYTYQSGSMRITFHDGGTTFRLMIRKAGGGINLTPSEIPNNGVYLDQSVDVDDLDAYISDNTVSLVPDANDVYDMYDALATAYPDYVTRTAKTSGGTTLYEYAFTTGDYNDNSGQRGRNPVIKKPVCLLTTGVHGYERSSVMGLYTFCKALCERDYRLADVINGVTFKVIPVVCPWGYTNDSRINANSVNINRNFASSTWELTSPGQNYSGAAPGDQDETKIVQAWLTANASDTTVFIDWHNSAYTDEISCFLGKYDADSLKWKKQYLIAINRIIPFWFNVRSIAATDIPAYTGGGIQPDTATGSSVSYARDLGILAFTMETSWDVNNTGKHSNYSIGIGAEAFVNTIRGFRPFWNEI